MKIEEINEKLNEIITRLDRIENMIDNNTCFVNSVGSNVLGEFIYETLIKRKE